MYGKNAFRPRSQFYANDGLQVIANNRGTQYDDQARYRVVNDFQVCYTFNFSTGYLSGSLIRRLFIRLSDKLPILVGPAIYSAVFWGEGAKKWS